MKKQISIYRMNRYGKFKPHRYTQNQCKVYTHPEYQYEINLVFRGDPELDENGFLIDHAEIDTAIQKARISGSCEEMHPRIFDAVMTAFEGYPDQPIAYRCAIKPSEHPMAYMEFVWAIKSKYLKLVK